MKERLFWQTVVVVSMAAVLAASCFKNPIEPVLSSDEEAIRAEFEANLDYFAVEGINDDGALPLSYESDTFSKSFDLIEPLKFGRKGHFRLEAFQVNFPEPGLAIVTVKYSFDGRFMILTPDSVYNKPMANTILRRAVFRKIENAENPRRRWRLRAISGSEAVSDGLCTIDFDSVSIQDQKGNKWTITDPLAFYRNLDEIPTFEPDDSVFVYVTVFNSQEDSEQPGTTVLLRYRNDRGMHRARTPFNDEGVYPDLVAGDGLYSGVWKVHHRKGIFHAFVDAIDNDTIYTDNRPYNSRVWGIPYIVE